MKDISIENLTDIMIDQDRHTTTSCQQTKELTIEDVKIMCEALNKAIMEQEIFKTTMRIIPRISYGIKTTHNYGIRHFS